MNYQNRQKRVKHNFDTTHRDMIKAIIANMIVSDMPSGNLISCISELQVLYRLNWNHSLW